MELFPVLATIFVDAIVIYVSLAARHRTRERFYSLIRRIFWPFYRYVKPGHSGILCIYLLWVLTGFVVVFLAAMVVLR